MNIIQSTGAADPFADAKPGQRFTVQEIDRHQAKLNMELARENVISILVREVEKQRREKPLLNAVPVTGITDYATAGQRIALAMHHLDESIPMGQKLRTEFATELLKYGLEDLTTWLAAKGYGV